MNYFVYEIKIDGLRRYVGITNNVKKRQTQHNYGLRKDLKKYLYKMIRDINPEYKIELEVISECSNKLEASRLECFIILNDYYDKKELFQAPPFSFKYF